MIAQNHVAEWKQYAPWRTFAMIEQDLIISKALVCLYNEPKIKESLVFRGGTALNKLFIQPPVRYSEDIDFVQRRPEPIGESMSAIRRVLDPWLGEPKRKITERGVKLIYKFNDINGSSAKLKIEINTTEHFQVLDLYQIPFTVKSSWFNGDCIIKTYQIEELMATKLRALYQRRKGRDLFDLWWVSTRNLVDIAKMIDIFHKYCLNDKRIIPREIFLKNLMDKHSSKDFQIDMNVLLAGDTEWNFGEAFDFVLENIIWKIPQSMKDQTKQPSAKQEKTELSEV